MAQRFGGRFSPGSGGSPGTSPAGVPRRSRAGLRAHLMFLPPALLTLLALPLWGADGLGLANLMAAAVLFLAAWLNREGLIAQDAFDARVSARRPVPRRIAAALLTGCAVCGLGFAQGSDLVLSTLAGLVAAGLHLVAFGADPLADKRPPGVDAYQSGRAAKVTDEAEALLAEMRAAVLALGDRHLTDRVDAFAASVRALSAQVAADPRDLAGARRYLGVYLRGARDATARFAALHARSGDERARADWLALLDDMQKGMDGRAEKLMVDDRTGLDIEIDVLRDRLRREGVAVSAGPLLAEVAPAEGPFREPPRHAAPSTEEETR